MKEDLFLDSMRVRPRIHGNLRLAIITRAMDGLYQRRALLRTWRPESTPFHDMTLSIRCSTGGKGARESISTARALAADVEPFVNRAVDSFSRGFYTELASQALRDERGLAYRGTGNEFPFAPYAIATLGRERENIAVQDGAVPANLHINPNFEAFRDPERLLKLGFADDVRGAYR